MEYIFYLNLNPVPYEQARDLQKQLAALKKEGEFPDFLILLEHPAVYTLGRWGKEENLLVSPDLLRQKGISLVRCERGGDITFHGPGQLVGYPVMNLKNYGLGVKDYVSLLEEVLIQSLSDWGVLASRKKGFPGVWVDGQKIASIGVAVRKGIAFHGFALNYAPNRERFDWIAPCGLDDVKMISLQEIIGEAINPESLRERVAFHFGEIFKVRLVPMEEKDLKALLADQISHQSSAINPQSFSIPTPNSEFRTLNSAPCSPNFQLLTPNAERRTLNVLPLIPRSEIRNPKSEIRNGKPAWLRKKIPPGAHKTGIENLIKSKGLHTVCQEARCPNQGECFSKGQATFLLMGSRCTRNCSFCAVAPGLPEPLNNREPEQIAQTVKIMALSYAVLTSVTRDDLPDGGAGHFVKTLKAIGRISPDTKVECLIPDFKGSEPALNQVAETGLCVVNHNIETIRRLYPSVRPGAGYNRSLNIFNFFKQNYPRLLTKSGFMVGFGETKEEIRALLLDLLDHGCKIVTIGQYLRPSSAHYPVRRFVTPEEFKQWEEEALNMGFAAVASGPFVRSSFKARGSYDKASSGSYKISSEDLSRT